MEKTNVYYFNKNLLDIFDIIRKIFPKNNDFYFMRKKFILMKKINDEYAIKSNCDYLWNNRIQIFEKDINYFCNIENTNYKDKKEKELYMRNLSMSKDMLDKISTDDMDSIWHHLNLILEFAIKYKLENN